MDAFTGSSFGQAKRINETKFLVRVAGQIRGQWLKELCVLWLLMLEVLDVVREVSIILRTYPGLLNELPLSETNDSDVEISGLKRSLGQLGKLTRTTLTASINQSKVEPK